MGRPPERWGYHQLSPKAARRLVADAARRVIAVELHPGRARHLEARFGARIVVVRADASDLRLPRRPFHVVANPPYAIITALLRRLLHPHSRMVSAHLVLPRWAVQRWTKPDAPGAGRWMHAFDTRPGRAVPRAAFRPATRSDSQVLVIRRRV